MNRKRIPCTDQEWFEAIMECRSGSLSDRKWCEANGISRYSLNYHIKKLRGKGYDIPRHVRTRSACVKQEVIPLIFNEENHFPDDCHNDHPENWMIAASMSVGNIRIDIHDGASASTISDILSALGGLSC